MIDRYSQVMVNLNGKVERSIASARITKRHRAVIGHGNWRDAYGASHLLPKDVRRKQHEKQYQNEEYFFHFLTANVGDNQRRLKKLIFR